MTQLAFQHQLTPEEPFSFENLYSHPGEMSAFDCGGPRKKIAVIGAGIAGLVAGYELKNLDHRVQIFEASARYGGRIFTHRFSDGTYGELGAMRLPSNHASVMHYVEKFGLPLRYFVNHNPNAFYNIAGHRTRIGDWKSLLAFFPGLRPEEKIEPMALYENAMRQAMSRLSTEEKWEMFSNTLLSPTLVTYDNISLRQYLADILSEDALRYVGHATSMIQHAGVSFLETVIDFFGLFRVQQFEIEGGMDRLTDSFASHLEGEIKLSCGIEKVELEKDGVRLYWSENSKMKSERFDSVICTAPAPAVAMIEFDPPLPKSQFQAFQNVTYASAAKTIFRFRRRPWEFEDGVYGGGSFTDQPAQQCWYPSDNARPIDQSIAESFTGNDYESTVSAPLHWGPRDTSLSYEPGILTAAYTWQDQARKYRPFQRTDAERYVLSHLKCFHQNVEEYADEVVHLFWDDASSAGYGAFAFFAPGEHNLYQSAMCEPFPSGRARVFFAGEHLSIAHGWIQGAIQTSLHATRQLISGSGE